MGLAVMATVAAGASTATAGYDRAFVMSAVVLVVGAALALALPGKPRPERYVSSGEEFAEPVVVVEALG